eukprot:EG_transcript_10555
MATAGIRQLSAASLRLPCSLSSLSQRVSEALTRQPGHTVTVYEQTTGGLLNAALLAIPGASRFYRNGAIVYSRNGAALLPANLIQDVAKASKKNDDLDSYLQYKELYTTQVARHVRSAANTTWSVAEGGCAGPTFGVAGVDRGFSAICVSGPVEKAVVVRSDVANREANMWLFAKAALDLLEECLVEAEGGAERQVQGCGDRGGESADPSLTNVIQYKEDRYGGVVVEMDDEAYGSPAQFEAALDQMLGLWRSQGKRGCWMHLPASCADLVPLCLRRGFVYHHAKPCYCVLTLWLPGDAEPNKLPPFANTQIGVGGCVLNAKNEILLVTERVSPLAKGQGLWKLPGGLADPGESIHACAQREVWEETGVRAEVEAILSFRHAHRYRFGVDDFYFVTRMRCAPGRETLNIDPKEIGEAQWMSQEQVARVFAEGRMIEINKFIVDLAFSGKSAIVGRSLPSLRGPPALVYSVQSGPSEAPTPDH